MKIEKKMKKMKIMEKEEDGILVLSYIVGGSKHWFYIAFLSDRYEDKKTFSSAFSRNSRRYGVFPCSRSYMIQGSELAKTKVTTTEMLGLQNKVLILPNKLKLFLGEN